MSRAIIRLFACLFVWGWEWGGIEGAGAAPSGSEGRALGRRTSSCREEGPGLDRLPPRSWLGCPGLERGRFISGALASTLGSGWVRAAGNPNAPVFSGGPVVFTGLCCEDGALCSPCKVASNLLRLLRAN